MKKWAKPQLLVLCRSKPEEVLGYTCKVTSNAISSMQPSGVGFDCGSSNTFTCVACSSTSGS